MARTYNKPGSAPADASETLQEKKAAEKTAVVRPVKKVSAPVRQETTEKTVIAAPDEKLMEKIVYQPSSQILTRDTETNESFGIGDDMPIYYL